MGAIVDGLPVGSSRNKIEYLAEQMESISDSGTGSGTSGDIELFDIPATMPFRMWKDHLQLNKNGFEGFVFRYFSGDQPVGDSDYFINDSDSGDIALVLYPMMQKIIKKNMGAEQYEQYQAEIESLPWNETAVSFGFQIMVDFWADFPAGHAPTTDTIRITLGSSYFYLPYEWDGTRLSFRGVVGGTLGVRDYVPDDTTNMTLLEKMNELTSPILKMSVEGLNLEDADDLQTSGVLHVVSASYGMMGE